MQWQIRDGTHGHEGGGLSARGRGDRRGKETVETTDYRTSHAEPNQTTREERSGCTLLGDSSKSSRLSPLREAVAMSCPASHKPNVKGKETDLSLLNKEESQVVPTWEDLPLTQVPNYLAGIQFGGKGRRGRGT